MADDELEPLRSLLACAHENEKRELPARKVILKLLDRLGARITRRPVAKLIKTENNKDAA